MIGWLFSPLVLVATGVGIGLFTLKLDPMERVFDVRVLMAVVAVSAIFSAGITHVLLCVELKATTTLRDHLRHMWLVYPALLLSGAILRGHVAIAFIFPFAALAGVAVGNLFAVLYSARHN